MNRWVELGTVGRPHGLKGALLVASFGGANSSLAYLRHVHVGKSVEELTQFEILEASWMPKGWVLKLSGVASNVKADCWRGQKVFADRGDLKSTHDGEYYTADLVGMTVYDTETSGKVGTLAGVEAGGGGSADRWWISSPKGDFALPATGRYIQRVDVLSGSLYLKNLVELRDLEIHE